MTDPSEDFETTLAEARKALRAMRSGTPREDAEPARGQGESVDGLVRVVAEYGRLSTVEIDPRAMRYASHELAERFQEAANAALADLESNALAQGAPSAAELEAVADPAELDARLAELQDLSVRQMARYQQSLSEILARLGR